MEQRTYHGKIDPDQVANALIARFNQGGTAAQRLGRGDSVSVQIGTLDRYRRTENGLAVTITQTADGVNVSVGQPAWLDAAADLAQAGLGALFNPLSLLGNLGEIVSDVSSFSLPQQIWQTVDKYSRSVGAGLRGDPAKMAVACPYCGVANPPGAPTCTGCGAPLGEAQPVYCPQCGLQMQAGSQFCARCGHKLL